ncbi:hypothetical protein CSUI_009380, partial [Cystoisospora suis]
CRSFAAVCITLVVVSRPTETTVIGEQVTNARSC